MMRLILLCSFLVSTAFADQRPNILFIYADDQSHRTISCYPEAYDWVNTPHIDQLAKDGIRFTHAYIGSWCMASRATMLTGLQQYGVKTMRMEGEYPVSGVPWYLLLTKGKYKYIRTLVEGEMEELYDLKNDPEELDNLALKPEFARTLSRFRKATLKELKRTDAGMLNNLPSVSTQLDE